MAEQAWAKSFLAALESEVRAHPGEQSHQASGFPSPCDGSALAAGVSREAQLRAFLSYRIWVPNWLVSL